MRNRGVRLFALLAAIIALAGIPQPARAAEATLADIVVTNSSRDLLLYLRLENGLAPEIIEGVKNGIPATIVFEVELFSARSNWMDKKIYSGEVEHTLTYDTLKDQYSVTLSEKGVTRITGRTLEEAKALMTEINGFALMPLSGLTPDTIYTLSVRASLARKGLPGYFDYLIPFGGFKDMETDWHKV